MNRELVLAFSYENLVQYVENDLSSLTDLIVPVLEAEEQITQVVQDIRHSGYLLFVHGVSGSGKSTFLSSLKWRPHIPIREIRNIDASSLGDPDNPRAKLARLHQLIIKTAREVASEHATGPDARTCIVIDYLESLKDEEKTNILAFFRDLNALLRSEPILVVWPVTIRDDVEFMYNSASQFSSTMFHRRIPILEFSGPPANEYPKIAEKTITILNRGQVYHDFQLNDEDFDVARRKLNLLVQSKRTIREYLQIIREIWEERVGYVEQLRKTIPGTTEVWFVVCYPEAEGIVAQFAKRSPSAVEDTWNVNYSKLSEYIVDNQRSADWPTTPSYNRLALALTGILTTKIMYLPTNTFVTCAAAYVNDREVGIPITREEFEEMGVPEHWFTPSRARLMLETAPLYRQLTGEFPSKGDRRGGTVVQALDAARKPFEHINKVIASMSGARASDKPFNRAVAKALQHALHHNGFCDLSISAESIHPWLTKITPDILVTTSDRRYICLEFYYTTNPQPNRLAQYCLNKLNTYMNQVEEIHRSGRLPLLF